MTDCIFTDTKHKTPNGCIILVCKCEPERCPFYKNEELLMQSMHKAHMNYQKHNPQGDYIRTVPPIYQEKLRQWEARQEAQND